MVTPFSGLATPVLFHQDRCGRAAGVFEIADRAVCFADKDILVAVAVDIDKGRAAAVPGIDPVQGIAGPHRCAMIGSVLVPKF